MKKIISALFALIMCGAVFASCGANPKCDHEAALQKLSENEEITAYIAADDKEYTLLGGELAEMLSGKWEKSGKPQKFDKIIALTIDTQYEICFFEDGGAIVYCGYADVLQSDRQYYKCELDEDIEDICQYVRDNGEILEREDD